MNRRRQCRHLWATSGDGGMGGDGRGVAGGSLRISRMTEVNEAAIRRITNEQRWASDQ